MHATCMPDIRHPYQEASRDNSRHLGDDPTESRRTGSLTLATAQFVCKQLQPGGGGCPGSQSCTGKPSKMSLPPHNWDP